MRLRNMENGNCGLITTSRSAAFGARYFERCGKALVVKYPWTLATLLKFNEKSCIAGRLCYAFHIKPGQKNNPGALQGLKECLFNVGNLIRYSRPELFPLSVNEMEVLNERMKKCVSVDLLPEDVKVAMGMLRYLRQGILMTGKYS
ncbi:uncharacterized protein LOC144168494 [Haemaphysalis longicornis]